MKTRLEELNELINEVEAKIYRFTDDLDVWTLIEKKVRYEIEKQDLIKKNKLI